MILKKNEFTISSFLEYLKETYGSKKPNGVDFNRNDVGQYLRKGMLPYKYGGHKVRGERQNGISIVIMEPSK